MQKTLEALFDSLHNTIDKSIALLCDEAVEVVAMTRHLTKEGVDHGTLQLKDGGPISMGTISTCWNIYMLPGNVKCKVLKCLL